MASQRRQQIRSPGESEQHDCSEDDADPGHESRRKVIVDSDLDEKIGQAPEQRDAGESEPCSRAHSHLRRATPLRRGSSRMTGLVALQPKRFMADLEMS